MDCWTLKLFALFHDPPHKPLALGRGHERQGKHIAAELTGTQPPAQGSPEWEAIKRADRLASGADRESWLKGVAVDPKKNLAVVHPLDGRAIAGSRRPDQPLGIFFDPEVIDRAESLGAELPGVFSGIDNSFLRYVLVWRFLADALRRLEGDAEGNAKRLRLGVLWDLLPAESRMPDHAVATHDSLVAALAPILAEGDEPAIVRFAIGPVQSFIQAARKLRDLWAGSSILAETAWEALKVFVEEAGPDSVIFPALRGEPRLDRWLLTKVRGLAVGSVLGAILEEARNTLARSLRIPSLPNVFTAVVGRRQAVDLAARAEKAAREFWQEQARQAAKSASADAACIERAAAQAGSLVEVAWSVAPWPVPESIPGAAVPGCLVWHRERPLYEPALEAREAMRAALGGYEPNGGVFYADVFEQAGVLLDAAKRERLRDDRGEAGLKCSLCGEREVLLAGDFWAQRQAAREGARAGDAIEALCGPCRWKRQFDIRLDESDCEFGSRHPSTGEIAASSFKLDLIRQAIANPRLAMAIEAFVAAVEKAVEAGEIDKADRQVFSAQAVDLAAPKAGEVGKKFASIDGQWLLPHPREENRGVGGEKIAAVKQAARELWRAARDCNIRPPRPYLAVVVFDGDHMGRWVSGTHEHFPRVWGALHPELRNLLEQGPAARACEELKRTPRMLAPSFHAALSAAAATFARITAPMTIEGEGLPGHLVYAGGDDALFFAPLECALELVWRLRRRFSGWPRPFAEAAQDARRIDPWIAARLGESGLPLVATNPGEVHRLGLAFGRHATASAGLCVFHYRWPLGSALEMARDAERRAKESGRDALGLVIQRRSGSITRATIPFAAVAADGGKEPPIESLQRLVAMMRDGVSPRLASLLRAELHALRPEAGGGSELWPLADALAGRVARRRDTAGEGTQTAEIGAVLRQLGEAARARNPGRTPEALVEWCEMVTAGAFVAREGDEG